MEAFQREGLVILINAPGHVLYLLVSLAAGHSSNWYPARLGPSVWRVLIFPLCAIPAWFFVGRALDALFAKTQLRRVDLVISTTLFALFLIISVGLRFGLSPEERAGQLLLTWYIYGFALWALLMTIPVVAWTKQRALRLNPSR
jgi:hypothetical protein